MVTVTEGDTCWDPAAGFSPMDMRKYNFISIQPHQAVATQNQAELPPLCMLGTDPGAH